MLFFRVEVDEGVTVQQMSFSPPDSVHTYHGFQAYACTTIICIYCTERVEPNAWPADKVARQSFNTIFYILFWTFLWLALIQMSFFFF